MWLPFLILEIGPVLVMYWGADAWRKVQRNVEASRRAHGSVLALRLYGSKKRTHALLAFTTSTGEKVETLSAHPVHRNQEPGSSVKVRYMPERPAAAWIEGEAEAETNFGLFFSVAVFIVWTAVMAWYAFFR
ncbi:DUF3592 domain-containing protein [Planomonospora corallina]|uniref:DUF3592 domain-containing protein n=1 Tax=Planomonospora corallina TaxID=1806052 RepID=A0ABV8I094_9ACTN